MQSGNDRGLFTSLNDSIHTKEVTGLAIDGLNHYLISSSRDHTVKLWDFYKQKLRSHNGLSELTPAIDFGFSENR